MLFGWLISGFMNQDYWILEETPFAEESIRDDLTDPILMQKFLVGCKSGNRKKKIVNAEFSFKKNPNGIV